jgi:hypothetical protein
MPGSTAAAKKTRKSAQIIGEVSLRFNEPVRALFLMFFLLEEFLMGFNDKIRKSAMKKTLFW